MALTRMSSHVAAGRIQGQNGQLSVWGDDGTIATVREGNVDTVVLMLAAHSKCLANSRHSIGEDDGGGGDDDGGGKFSQISAWLVKKELR